MKIYLVGGAVRDKKLNIQSKDMDYVVVGGTPEYFLNNRYEQVGADFPVFLHPETKDEYALARKERKTGLGYNGFTCDYDTSITLKDDLYRRDLTINALAEDLKTGDIIDYFGGLDDIKNKKLRHISTHFKDDPLRLLRVARFAARYKKFGFTIADETLDLMKNMVQNGEVNHLTAERIKLETDKALLEDDPDEYFYILKECGALKVIFPEIDALFGVPQTKEHHPEIDSGIHTMMVLMEAKKLTHKHKLNQDDSLLVLWMALSHDFGKAVTEKSMLPRHIGHEMAGVSIIDEFSDRLKLNNQQRNMCKRCSLYHLHFHRIKEMKPESILKLIKNFDYFRNPNNLKLMALACEADARGRLGFENREYNQSEYLFKSIQYLNLIDQEAISNEVKLNNQNPKNLGKEIAQAIDNKRRYIISISIQLTNNRESVLSRFSFLENITTNDDIQNLLNNARKIIKNPELITILSKESNTVYDPQHIQKIIDFGKAVDAIDPEKFILYGYKGKEIAEKIKREKEQLLKSYFNIELKEKIKTTTKRKQKQ